MGERLKEEVRFGKYTLIERIAVGGMAEIFLARQAGVEGFEKLIVIKKIRSHLSKQKSFVNMFLNEAKLAAQLNHPNVVQIFDLGRIGESYFIAMEYVHGRDMRAVLPRAEHLKISPFPLVYALKICSSVCEGLFYAHGKNDGYGQPLGIVHRDISPENILVSFDGSVKLTDFGIAKATTQLEHTRAGEIKGKLSYMSPEQCRGEKVDHRSDLFSLGVVLYEWLTGVKLFTGESELEILQSIIDGKIYPASYFRDDIPDTVTEILDKALAISRDDRYQSAWDMQYDIDSFLSQHEFTPSNVHLANFMKQLFAEELGREAARDREAGRESSDRRAGSRPGGSRPGGSRPGGSQPGGSKPGVEEVLSPEELGAELVDESDGALALVDDSSLVISDDALELSDEIEEVPRRSSGVQTAVRRPSRGSDVVSRDGSQSARKGPPPLSATQRRKASAGAGAASHRLELMLGDEAWARLQRAAERRGESIEEVAADMVAAFLKYTE